MVEAVEDLLVEIRSAPVAVGASSMAVLNWSGARNVRDIGGLKLMAGGFTADRSVIRSGELDHLTPDGHAALLAADPSRIIDLRSAREMSVRSPLVSHQGDRHLPFIDSTRVQLVGSSLTGVPRIGGGT